MIQLKPAENITESVKKKMKVTLISFPFLKKIIKQTTHTPLADSSQYELPFDFFLPFYNQILFIFPDAGPNQAKVKANNVFYLLLDGAFTTLMQMLHKMVTLIIKLSLY